MMFNSAQVHKNNRLVNCCAILAQISFCFHFLGSICTRAIFTLILEMFTVQPKQFDVIVVTAVILYTL